MVPNNCLQKMSTSVNMLIKYQGAGVLHTAAIKRPAMVYKKAIYFNILSFMIKINKLDKNNKK